VEEWDQPDNPSCLGYNIRGKDLRAALGYIFTMPGGRREFRRYFALMKLCGAGDRPKLTGADQRGLYVRLISVLYSKPPKLMSR
jgi:hypothetical protein